MKFYKLDGHEVVECTMLEWTDSVFNSTTFIPKVAADNVNNIYISTVFIGISHSDTPLPFETYVGYPEGELIIRSETWDEAVRIHNEQVQKCIKLTSVHSSSNNYEL